LTPELFLTSVDNWIQDLDEIAAARDENERARAIVHLRLNMEQVAHTIRAVKDRRDS
jgi:hypothetical protein